MEDTWNNNILVLHRRYFTLSGGSRCCYRQMLKITVCWKEISCCVVHKFPQNIGTLSNKHHITSYNICYRMADKLHQNQEAMDTYNGHSHVFPAEQTWFTNT